MMIERLGRCGLVGVLFAAILFLGLKICQDLPEDAFAVPGVEYPNAETIGTMIDKTINGKPAPGQYVELATVKRNDRELLSFFLLEGTFKNRSIEPQEVWRKVFDDRTMLINSADEYLRNDGGISEAIGNGCAIDQLKTPLATGSLHLTACHGEYRALFPNLDRVGNAIIKTWEAVGEKEKCELDADRAARSEVTNYNKCVHEAIESSLTSLFDGKKTRDVNLVVLPALGTGTAGVPKGIFYQVVSDVLLKCLRSKEHCYRGLPRRLIFIVWSNDSQRSWTDTRDALARNLAKLRDDWNANYAPEFSVTQKERILGVLCVLLAFVTLVLFRQSLPAKVATRLPGSDPVLLGLIVIGWGVVGSATALSDFMDHLAPLGDPNTFRAAAANIFLGVLGAISCGLIHKATKLFEGLSSPEASAAASQPATDPEAVD